MACGGIWPSEHSALRTLHAPGDWWHPKWWKADTMSGQAVTLKNMEQVNDFLPPIHQLSISHIQIDHYHQAAQWNS